MSKIKIILADDHVVVRQGVRTLLDQEKDMAVIGEADDGLQLLDMTEKLRPDVVIIDLTMPNMNGMDAAEQINKRFPKVHSVVLTMHADRSYIERAMRVGVCGYVLKEEDIREICTAIRHAAQGNHYLSEAVTRRIPDLKDKSTAALDPISLLTMRERQVFQMVAEGKTNQETATTLGISVRTVEVHRAHMMSKLNTKTHVEFIRFAMKHGILADNEK
jgi:two-component system, NarL family, response regulator NreC